MDHYGGGSWSMIPNIATHSNPSTPSSQDHLFLQQQQFNQQQQFQQPPQQFNQQQQFQQQFNQQQQFQSPQQIQQPQRYQYQQPPPPPQPQPQPQQQQQQQSLASLFHLLHLVENLADVAENGNRDQHSDALVNELNNQFEKCQQLLNSISSSINTKAMTVEGQKQKLGQSEELLNQRRDLIAKYRSSVEELIKPEL